jgi:raffinose/stachyose/melibiose transport system permease protein
MVFMSLKNNPEIFGGNTMGPPSVFRWENYRNAIKNGNLGIFFFNSFSFSVISIFFSTLFASMAAYAVTRMRWRYGRLALNVFLLGVMIPSQAIILPIYIILVRTGLYNTRLSLILVYIVFTFPVAIFLISGYLRNLPVELEESAIIDGAGLHRLFFIIILPVITPVIATVIIFSFLYTWNEFMYAFILVEENKLRTLTVGLLSMKGRYDTNWGAMGAGFVIVTFPTIIFYLFFNNTIQKSLIAGAVKG